MTTMETIDREKLEALSIFELRDLARKVGVYSPTVLQKGKLIEEINLILSGQKEPFVPKNRQGRPAKKLSGYDNIVNVLLPNNPTELTTFDDKNAPKPSPNVITMMQNVDSAQYSPPVVKHGFVELLDNKSALIVPNIDDRVAVSDYVYVVNQTVERYNLKSGDEIICNANFISKDKPMVLSDIVSINGVALDKHTRTRSDYDEWSHVSTDDLLGNASDERFLSSKPIHLGDNVMLYCNENGTAFLSKFIATIPNSRPVIYLNPAITNKNRDIVKTIPSIQPFCSDYINSFTNQKKISYLALNRAKRLAENGEDVVLVVDDALTLANVCQDNDLILLKTLFNSAKHTKHGSITIITALGEPLTPLHHSAYNTIVKLQNVAIYIQQ